MKIIIAGAGEVGTHLAKMLSKEKHSITVLDEREDVLNSLNANYDLLTLYGSPNSIDKLREAGCEKADLFIGVTPEECRNITACYLASRLGARKTVARVESPEYMTPENQEYFRSLGINRLICPEILAAKDIADTVDRPWVRQFHEFDKGALVLIGLKIRGNAPILGKKLKDIFSSDEHCRVAAIKRRTQTIIPKGNDCIQEDDMVYFIATPDHIDTVRKIAGKPVESVHDVMIMGGSRIAVMAAREMAKRFDVKIIEHGKARSEYVKEQLGSNVMVIQGDGRDVDLLRDEGIENTEAYIALTGSAETNIFSCLAAKRFGVQRTVAEVENLDYIPLAENLDIGIVINKKLIAASYIYQMMLDADVANMKCLTFADADVAEFIVKEGARVTRHPVKDLLLPDEVSLGGLIRDGQGIIIYGNTRILPGDRVVVFCANSSLQKLDKYFN